MTLAAALCVGSASASAVEVYDFEPDVQLFSMRSAASTLAATDDWYSYVLQNLEWIMDDISDINSGFGFPSNDSLYSHLQDLVGTADNTLTYVGDIAWWLGASPTSGDPTLGEWLGMSGATSTAFSLYNLISWIDDSTSLMAVQLGDIDTELSLFRSGWASAMTIPAGTTIVNSGGFTAVASGDRSLVQLLNLAFRGSLLSYRLLKVIFILMHQAIVFRPLAT